MQIVKPTFCVDLNQVRNNLLEMKQKADESGVLLRPHFKTHQSVEVAQLAKDVGINTCTVSSLEMACYFAEHGWNDITVAFPVNILEKDRINTLAKRVNLALLVENTDAIDFLQSKLMSKISVWIKVDCGYGRTGVGIQNFLELNRLKQKIEDSEKLSFKGFLTHNGTTYKCRSKEEITQQHNLVLKDLAMLKKHFPDALISYGDTPSCSVASSFDNIDEIRPGNFVYYDLMQHYIGSCALTQVAVTLKCPVVAVHSERNAVVIYGGAVHFSKESFRINDDLSVFGLVKRINETEFDKEIFITQLSQEHGVVSYSDSVIGKVKVGDILEVVPVHSCLAANLMKNDTLYE